MNKRYRIILLLLLLIMGNITTGMGINETEASSGNNIISVGRKKVNQWFNGRGQWIIIKNPTWNTNVTNIDSNKRGLNTIGDHYRYVMGYSSMPGWSNSRASFEKNCRYPNGKPADWMLVYSWKYNRSGERVLFTGASPQWQNAPLTKLRQMGLVSNVESIKRTIKNLLPRDETATVICSSQISNTSTVDGPPGSKDKSNDKTNENPVVDRQPIKLTDSCVAPKPTSKTVKNPHQIAIEGVYAISGQLTANKPYNYDTMTEEQKKNWDRDHQNQFLGTHLTEFGKILTDMGANPESHDGAGEISISGEQWNKYKDKLIAAAKKSSPKMDIELNENNVNGFGSGGLYTVTKNKMKVKVQIESEKTINESSTCSFTGKEVLEKKYPKAQYLKPTIQSGGYRVAEDNENWLVYRKLPKITTNKTEKTNITGVKIIPGNWETESSYQLIGVRCNTKTLNSQLNGATIISTGSTSGNMSMAAKSPITQRGISTHFSALNYTDFFLNGKECQFTCSPNATSTPKNDIGNNVLDKQKDKMINEGLYGAQSGGLVSSKIQVFRDNANKDIRLDVWGIVPEANSIELKNVSNPASKTVFVPDSTGTPANKDFVVGTKTSDGKELEIYNGTQLKESHVVPGQINKIFTRASWASEADHPHRFNAFYVYSPTINSYVPKTFNTSGDITDKKIVSSILNAMCKTNFNNNSTFPADVSVEALNNEQLKDKYNKFNSKTNDYIEIMFVKSSKS